MNPCLAIIDSSTLGRIALAGMLQDAYGQVEIHAYGNMMEFIRDSNRHFIHFFVSSDILFRHIDEFDMLRSRTTVLSTGPDRRFESAGYNVLDISLPEGEITGRLLHIRLAAHYEERDPDGKADGRFAANGLSSREKEVLRLIIKGKINKEIAMELGISLTTVIFHRNNICEKLQTRSIGKLTIFAVLSGIIDINEI